MKNISRNGIQAVAVYKDSYLGHGPYPNFSLNGEKPFTIEVRFAYTDHGNGILYSQENGMTIGIDDDIPYFSHPTLGKLGGADIIKFKPNYLMMVSVTYDGTEICLHSNGVPVAQKVKDSLETANDDGDFFIGKEFEGFIEGIRVLDNALTAEELMKEYGGGFQEKNGIVFQTDFSTKQYKDIGPDNIQLWRTGSEAGCANVVSATKLSSKAAYKRNNKLSFSDGFSVSARFYPDFSSGKKQTIYALGNDSSSLSISMELGSEDFFVLSANIGSKTLRSTIEVVALTWHDVVLSLDICQKKVSIYLDGDVVASGDTDVEELLDTVAVIGSEFFIDGPRYKEGFAGLIDYVAEFSKAVNDTEVERFIEHEPYFYDDGIASLLLFGWGEPKNAMLGTNIAEYGDGYYTMEKETNPLDAPKGTGWLVPQEPDEEYWNSLSDNERWALEMYVKMANESIQGFTGVVMDVGNPESQIIHRRYLGPDAQAVLEWANGNGDEDMDSVFNVESTMNHRIHTLLEETEPESLAAIQQVDMIQVGGAVSIAAIASGSLLTNCTASTEIMKDDLAAVVVIEALIVVAEIVKLLEDDRPIPKADKIELISCSWNNLGKADSGTIYFHCDKGSLTGPSSMEWKNNGSNVDMQAVFVPSELKELNMRVKVINIGDKVYSGRIKMTDNSGVVGMSEEMLLLPGASATVSIKHNDLKKYQDTTIRNVRGVYALYFDTDDKCFFIGNVKYNYYTLLRKPIDPWKTGEGYDYDPNFPYYVHTDFLEILFDEKKNGLTDPHIDPGEQPVIQGYVLALYKSVNFTYDRLGGGRSFYSRDYNYFKIYKYAADCADTANLHLLNCMDCANIMHKYCAQHGIHLPMISLIGMDGYELNQYQGIYGRGEVAMWEPVHGIGYFNYHMVNRTASGGTSYDDQVGIYDACLAIDNGEHPGRNYDAADPNQKDPRLSTGMRAQKDDTYVVDCDTTIPYTIETYRERLVRNGEVAVFINYPGDIQYFTREMTVNKISEPGILSMEEKIKVNDKVSNLRFLTSEFDEYEWRFLYDGCEIELVYYAWAHSDIDIKHIIRQYSHPQKIMINDEESGIEGIKTGEKCYLIRKGEKVYCVIGEKAWDVAKEVI